MISMSLIAFNLDVACSSKVKMAIERDEITDRLCLKKQTKNI